jgi:hypothetical protein
MLLFGNVDVLHVLKWYWFVCVVGHACGEVTASDWLGRQTSSGLLIATASERKNPSHQHVNRVCQIFKSKDVMFKSTICFIIYVTYYFPKDNEIRVCRKCASLSELDAGWGGGGGDMTSEYISSSISSGLPIWHAVRFFSAVFPDTDVRLPGPIPSLWS